MALNKLPNNVSDKNALFVGDVLATGYFGAEMCEITKEDTVAVIGCGPVGLCSIMCARVLGAEKIIAIDIEQSRLEIAKNQKLADFYLNPKEISIENEIKSLTYGRGADKVIEAAGAHDTFELAWKIAKPNAIVAVVALYEDNQIIPLKEWLEDVD